MAPSLFGQSAERSSRAVGAASVINVLARGVNIFSQLTTFVLLARLLTPADFGLVLMALPFIAILLVVGDLGLASWTLQAATISEEDASSLFWISATAGLCLTLLLAALSPAVGWFYGEPKVSAILAVLSIQFLFAGLSGQHRALLQRSLRFNSLAKVEITVSIASTLAAIIAAYFTRSPWALVTRFVLQQGLFCAGVWIASAWVPLRPKRHVGAWRMVRYGISIVGFSILNTSGRQIDSVLIGWRWGSMALGPYAFATRIFFLPVQQLMQPLSEVMIPVLSRLRDEPERYRQYFSSVLVLIGCIVAPPFVSIAVYSREVVVLAAGPGWESAAPILSVFASLGALYVFYSPIGWLMLSHGRAQRYFVWAALYVPIYLFAYVSGLPWGPLGVAIAYAGANALVLVPSWYYGSKGTPMRAAIFAKACVGPLLLATGTFAAAKTVRSQFSNLEPWALVLTALPIVVLAWAAAIAAYLRRPEVRVVIVEILKGAMPRKTAHGNPND